MEWIERASRYARRGHFDLAMVSRGVQHPFKLSPHVLKRLDVHPKTARRVLTKMAKEELVEVEFHRGRSRRVLILPVSRSDD